MSSHDSNSLQTYTINLDDPPSERWRQVARDHKDGIIKVLNYCDQILGAFSTSASWIAWLFSNYVFYIDELKGISEETGIDISQLVLMQLCYEVCSCCTSIVYETDEAPLHFRTMDWAMPELKDITLNIVFTKDGEPLYSATTWAGYVGIMTACRLSIGSVSLNYRRTNDGLVSNLNALIGGSWPAGFLIRHSIETAKNHDQFVAYLTNSTLISPCYFTISGQHKKSGKIIVRDRNNATIEECAGKYIVQTNVDNACPESCDNILLSHERLAEVEKILKTAQIGNLHDLDVALNRYPVINHETIYVSLMRCDRGIIYSRT